MEKLWRHTEGLDGLRFRIHEVTATMLDSAREAWGPALADVKERFGEAAPFYVVASSILVAAATLAVYRRSSSNQHQPAKKKLQKAGSEAKPKPPKKKKNQKIRMCKYCEAPIPTDLFMQAHLAGKKHRRLAGEYTPDECWVWVEKPSEEDKDVEKEAAPQPPTTDTQDDGTWETVESAASKKAKAAKAIKAKQKAAAAAAAAAPPSPKPAAALRVHRRCNDCGIRARDGATIETDPDDETKAYCTECWAAFLNHPEAAAPASQPAAEIKPWRTPYNRE